MHPLFPAGRPKLELELELIQTQMAQKPMLRAEVYAHAMRASQNRKKEVRREKAKTHPPTPPSRRFLV